MADHVGARPEERGELGQRLVRPGLGLGGVDDALGVQGDQRVDVVGGDHAGRVVEPAELGGVATHLGGAGGVDADQLQIGVLDQRPEGVEADVARRELDDPACHAVRAGEVPVRLAGRQLRAGGGLPADGAEVLHDLGHVEHVLLVPELPVAGVEQVV